MSVSASHNGWSRIAANLDVEIQRGIPVRITSSDSSYTIDEQGVADRIAELTGFSISIQDWVANAPDEQQWSVCIDPGQFERVLLNHALASAALYVDRFHKPIDVTAVDWDLAEFNYDFNRAIESYCIPYYSIDRKDFFAKYVTVMHDESVRLVEQGISPMVEAE